jgi:phospholipase/lecithinase/hemolysin
MLHRSPWGLIARTLARLPGRLACALGLVLLLSGLARAEPLTGVVVFGDSLSDVGNVYTATGGAAPPPPYAHGRFTNGSDWVQQFATREGIAAPTASLKGGTDYAYGFAQTGMGTSQTSIPGLSVPNMGTQINTYLGSNTPKSGQLFVVWGGANDFFNGQTNPAVPAANITADVKTLANAGATNFLVLNLPALGNTPFGSTLPSAQKQALNGLTAAFNSNLSNDLSQLQASDPAIAIHTVDTATLLQQIQANPSAYGFTNVTDSALLTGHVGDSGYLFWDTVHPTTQGHAFIAAAAVQAVPEPSTLILMGLGLAGAGLGTWRHRRQRHA